MAKGIKYKLPDNIRCGDCVYWRPFRRSEKRWTWGICLVGRFECKWTLECQEFFNLEYKRRGDIIYLAVCRKTQKDQEIYRSEKIY